MAGARRRATARGCRSASCGSRPACRSRSTPAASTATRSSAASRAPARPTRSASCSSSCCSRHGLQIVILDPNSDFARIDTARADTDSATAERWRALAPGIEIHSGTGERRLCVRLRELSREQQAAALRLDPVADSEEHAELDALVEDERPETFEDLMGAARPTARALAMRIRNLGIDRWGVWARDTGESALRSLAEPRAFAASCSTSARSTRHEEQAVVAGAVLGTLWERRAERRPVLIVIDEAHNVCPSDPPDTLTALADRVRRPDRRRGPQVRPLPARVHAAPAEGAGEHHLPVRQPGADADGLGGRPRLHRRPARRSHRALCSTARRRSGRARRWSPASSPLTPR